MSWDHSQLRLKVHPEKWWDEAVSNIPNIAGSWHSDSLLSEINLLRATTYTFMY